MFSIKCKCGEIYRFDERSVGFFIKCKNCSALFELQPSKPATSQATLFGNVTKPESSRKPYYLVGLLVSGAFLGWVLLIALNLTKPPAKEVDQSKVVIASKNVNSSPPTTEVDQSKVNIASKVESVNSNTEATNRSNAIGSPVPTPTIATTRYPTGKDLTKPGNFGGRGTLEISNGTSSDAIAKLVDNTTGKTVRLVFIRANTGFTMESIREGEYELKFSLGTGYVPDQGKFLYNQSFSKFDDFLNFTVDRRGDSIYWHNFRVTLNPVLGGTASTSSISESDFADK